jgi:hypothetical protein
VRVGDDGRVLLHCHAGCEPGAIVRALGLEMRDLFVPDDRPARTERQRSRPRPHPRCNGTADPCPPAGDLEAQAQRWALSLTAERRADLAEVLGVPEAALAALTLLGYCADDRHGPCWTLPEQDGAGRLIGMARRYQDAAKRAVPGGRRGLTVPSGWTERPGGVYLPEGASDTLTLTAMGLPAVGRPSCSGGVELLAELLRDWPADRAIIVLGEWDARPDGSWPGRDGATRTAERLAQALGRPVCWALPPDGAKDVRRWATAQETGATCADAWSELGERFVGAVQLQRVEPTGAAGPTGSAPAVGDPFGWLRRHHVPVVRVRKLGRLRGEYELILDDGRTIELGTAADVLTPRRVQAAVADVLGIALVVPTVARWRPVAQAILQAAEVVDCACDPGDELREWLRPTLEYGSRWLDVTELRAQYPKMTDREIIVERLRERCAVRSEDGRVYVTVSRLHRGLMMDHVRVTLPELCRRLRRAGWVPEQVAVRVGTATLKVRAWVSPLGWRDADG